ncbi:hypothetical protein M0R45_006897 [Rubus argutus]|uniref:Uncharacterized protein n=1 Tax=Rubus argutus TaxID=59490 RepID=A0AAW1YRT3_RUBAR
MPVHVNGPASEDLTTLEAYGEDSSTVGSPNEASTSEHVEPECDIEVVTDNATASNTNGSDSAHLADHGHESNSNSASDCHRDVNVALGHIESLEGTNSHDLLNIVPVESSVAGLNIAETNAPSDYRRDVNVDLGHIKSLEVW